METATPTTCPKCGNCTCPRIGKGSENCPDTSEAHCICHNEQTTSAKRWIVEGQHTVPTDTHIQMKGMTIVSGGIPIAHVFGNNENECEPETIANARLMASAPELLTACKALFAVIDKDIHLKAMLKQGDIGMINDALILGRAALSKAEAK